MLRGGKTSNVHLPLELSSNWRKTPAARVSDHLQLSLFRRGKNKSAKVSDRKTYFSSICSGFGGATAPNGCQNQLQRQILLQIDLFWGMYDQKTMNICPFQPSKPWGEYRYFRVQLLRNTITGAKESFDVRKLSASTSAKNLLAPKTALASEFRCLISYFQMKASWAFV